VHHGNLRTPAKKTFKLRSSSKSNPKSVTAERI